MLLGNLFGTFCLHGHDFHLQLAPPEAAQSPERNAQTKRERSVIARISAAETGAQEVGPRVDSGPLSMGLSLSNPNLPPLRPINGAPLLWPLPASSLSHVDMSSGVKSDACPVMAAKRAR